MVGEVGARSAPDFHVTGPKKTSVVWPKHTSTLYILLLLSSYRTSPNYCFLLYFALSSFSSKLRMSSLFFTPPSPPGRPYPPFHPLNHPSSPPKPAELTLSRTHHMKILPPPVKYINLIKFLGKRKTIHHTRQPLT